MSLETSRLWWSAGARALYNQECATSMPLTLKRKPICCLSAPFFAALHQQLSTEQRKQDLTLRHLAWEESAPCSSSRTPMSVYSVVELDVVRKGVCISPHFSYWQAGDRTHFLLNDLIDWWPPEELLPLIVVSKACQQGILLQF